MSVEKKIAKYFLQSEVVKLSPKEPFKWSSGWNSPIYCDNRIILSNPKARTYIKKKLSKLVKKKFPDADFIAGVATAGIAQGALVADKMELPFAYVRPKPKEHGMGKQIEGRIERDKKIVLVEDLISTGASSINAAEALRLEGLNVLGVVSIFTYGFDDAIKNFENTKIEWYSLCDYKFLIKEALKQNYISESDVLSLREWRADPANWNSQNKE